MGLRDMPLQRLKTGFGVFFALCVMLGANLLVFQTGTSAVSSKRIVFPGSSVADMGRPATTPLQSTLTSDDAQATPPVVVPVTTGSVIDGDLVRAVQRELKVLGYEAGAVDGVAGVTTRAAIMAFEWDNGLPLSAEPSQQILQGLLLGHGGNTAAGAPPDGQPGPEAVRVIQTVQHGLATLGVGGVKVTGTITPETQRAIRLFEVREGMAETGRISGPLAARILRLSGEKRVAAGR